MGSCLHINVKEDAHLKGIILLYEWVGYVISAFGTGLAKVNGSNVAHKKGSTMNPVLQMVQSEVELFRTGKIDLTSMWDKIDKDIERAKKGEETFTPFDDDRAEARTKRRF